MPIEPTHSSVRRGYSRNIWGRGCAHPAPPTLIIKSVAKGYRCLTSAILVVYITRSTAHLDMTFRITKTIS